MFDRISAILNKTTEKVVIVLLVIMAVDVFMNVTFRYIFKIAFISSEELARYLMIWASFLGISLAVRAKEHMGVEYFRERIGPTTYRYLVLISEMGMLFFFGVIFIYGWKLSIAGMENATPAMRISYFYVYLSIPLGCILAILQITGILITNFKTLRKV
jgi:TRAP-type C4-dicarboxylate transport system permease small subunit